MSRVVITGIGAITPVGNTAAETWDAVKNGKCGIGYITKFDPSDMRCRIAAEVKDFSPADVLDKNTVHKTDLFTQYALCAAQEAMDDSGIQNAVDPDRFGVYVGSGVGGINTMCQNEQALLQKGAKFVNPQFVPKMIINIAAGQLAIRFNAHGNALCLATACATGTSTVGEAYRAIKDGYLTAAIAGGTEAAITPLTVSGFANCMALTQAETPETACLPFDARRSGFVIGEGAAIVILEEYEHAVQRGAQIYAEVVGYGASCDAYHVTAPSPDGECTAKAIRQALEGVDYSCDSMYVNAHGTGTQLNDKTETKAFKLAFGDDAAKLNISSTKSETGHLLGAAGTIEAIVCALTLRDGVIPPTIGLQEPDAECDLNYTPNTALQKQVDTAISTSLGFGGHNACIALKRV